MSPARGAATALLLCAMLGTARAGDTTGGYSWPLPSGRTVTSTFGEYRPGHFHAGIDISSGDVAGAPVVAARAGDVARIIISPTGYGKMLEIRHDDGFTTVYAHLERFAPALEERARAAQAQLERYPVDVACAPGEFPVAAGDLIAYTGSTGTASPHLHFEVRDPRGDPVNPFRWPGLRVHDTIAPVIRRIAVIPLDPDATVDGSHAPRTLRPDQRTRTVVVTGRVGLAVSGRDRIPGSRFQSGVYARALFIDGTPAFSERLDRTPWHEAHEIELCYERGITGGGRYARLFINSPNHLRTYAPSLPTAGIIDAQALTPGTHTARILCADYAGNSAAARLTLVAGRPALPVATPVVPRAPEAPPPPMSIVCTPDEDGIVVRVTAESAFTALPSLSVEEGSATTAVVLRRVSAREYEGHFTPRGTIRGTRRLTAAAASGAGRAEARAAIDVEPVLPFTAGTIALEGGRLLVAYDSLSVLKPLYLCVATETGEGHAVYRLSPRSAVLGSGLTVTIASPAAGARAGIFFRAGGAWQFIGTRRAPGTGRIRVRLGDVALLTDSTPPELLGLREVREPAPAILFRFADNLAGVEYDSMKSYIDGHLVIPEIDGRRHRALAGAREHLARGPHQLALRLTDRMGNARTTVRRFVIR